MSLNCSSYSKISNDCPIQCIGTSCDGCNYSGTGFFGPGFPGEPTLHNMRFGIPPTITLSQAIDLLRQPNTYDPTQFGLGVAAGDINTFPDSTAVVLGNHVDSTGPNNGSYTVSIGNGAGQVDQQSNCVAIGNGAGYFGQIFYSVAVGPQAGSFYQGTLNQEFFIDGGSVAVGVEAGIDTQGATAVAVGPSAGASFQGVASVAVGFAAGGSAQGANSTAIGFFAGQYIQGFGCVAIGGNAGNTGQSDGAIAIGSNAGSITQGASAVAIGLNAGATAQGTGAIAIGALAGSTNQDANSIIINATGIEVDSVGASTCIITPIRNNDDVLLAGNRLHYDSVTGEVTWGIDEAPSSIRYKMGVNSLSDTFIDKILNLRPVEFTYTSSNKPGIGFIAEEVDEIIPEVVKRRNDVIESVDYQFLVAPLVKIIQKHEERINELSFQLKEMKNQV